MISASMTIQIITVIITTFIITDKFIYRIWKKLTGKYLTVHTYYSWKWFLIGTLFTHLLFFIGGFYTNGFSYPQIIMILLSIVQFGIEHTFNGYRKKDNFNIMITFGNYFFFLLLLYLGGFYYNLINLIF